MMSEHQADRLSIIAVAVMFPLIGLMKLVFAWVMVRYTWLQTPMGSWLVRMFVAIGLTFMLIGGAYGISALNAQGIYAAPIWIRWGLRVGGVVCGLWSLASTLMLARFVVDVLKEVEARGPQND